MQLIYLPYLKKEVVLLKEKVNYLTNELSRVRREPNNSPVPLKRHNNRLLEVEPIATGIKNNTVHSQDNAMVVKKMII